MCLAVPGKIEKIDGTMADVALGGITRSVSILFTPDAGVGDYVIVHAGFAINVLDQREAEETLSILKAMADEHGDE